MSRKTIWYKRASIGTMQNRNLQTLLTAALDKLQTAGKRLRKPSVESENELELINGWGSRYGMLCGNFVRFEAGQRQPYLRGVDTAKSFDLDAIAPPKGQPEERREFLEGVAYFGIHENHVLLCQSKHGITRELERYLNWILWEQTTVLPKPTAVVLADQPSKRLVEKLNKNPIKSVSIGTPLEYSSVAGSATQSRVTQVRLTPDSLGAGVLEALFSDSIFDKASFSDAIKADNIEVEVTVRFKHKQHVSQSGEQLLRSLAKAARHLNVEDVEIELYKAGTIKGDELKVHTAMDIKTSDSGLIREDDLNQHMAQWLKDLLESRMVDP